MLFKVVELKDIEFVESSNKIGNYKIMTMEEILKEHPELQDREVFDCHIYTKIKELERR